MAGVPSRLTFSLVFRNPCVYVFVITSSLEIYRKVLNAAFHVEHLLMMVNVVEAAT